MVGMGFGCHCLIWFFKNIGDTTTTYQLLLFACVRPFVVLVTALDDILDPQQTRQLQRYICQQQRVQHISFWNERASREQDTQDKDKGKGSGGGNAPPRGSALITHGL